VLFLNGTMLLGWVEERSAAPLNLLVGLLQVVTPTTSPSVRTGTRTSFSRLGVLGRSVDHQRDPTTTRPRLGPAAGPAHGIGITRKEEARSSGHAYQCCMLDEGGFEVHKARLFRG